MFLFKRLKQNVHSRPKSCPCFHAIGCGKFKSIRRVSPTLTNVGPTVNLLFKTILPPLILTTIIADPTLYEETPATPSFPGCPFYRRLRGFVAEPRTCFPHCRRWSR